MPRKQHLVRLGHEDRRTLTRMVRTGQRAAWSLQRARILLACDASSAGPARTDAQVADVLGISARTRAAWGRRGMACLTRQPQVRPSVPPKLSPSQCLEIAAEACTTPPPGYARWSLRLLRGRVIDRGIVDSISVETLRQALQKGGSGPGVPSASSSRHSATRPSSRRWS